MAKVETQDSIPEPKGPSVRETRPLKSESSMQCCSSIFAGKSATVKSNLKTDGDEDLFKNLRCTDCRDTKMSDEKMKRKSRRGSKELDKDDDITKSEDIESIDRDTKSISKRKSEGKDRKESKKRSTKEDTKEPSDRKSVTDKKKSTAKEMDDGKDDRKSKKRRTKEKIDEEELPKSESLESIDRDTRKSHARNKSRNKDKESGRRRSKDDIKEKDDDSGRRESSDRHSRKSHARKSRADDDKDSRRRRSEDDTKDGERKRSGIDKKKSIANDEDDEKDDKKSERRKSKQDETDKDDAPESESASSRKSRRESDKRRSTEFSAEDDEDGSGKGVPCLECRQSYNSDMDEERNKRMEAVGIICRECRRSVPDATLAALEKKMVTVATEPNKEDIKDAADETLKTDSISSVESEAKKVAGKKISFGKKSKELAKGKASKKANEKKDKEIVAKPSEATSVKKVTVAPETGPHSIAPQAKGSDTGSSGSMYSYQARGRMSCGRQSKCCVPRTGPGKTKYCEKQKICASPSKKGAGKVVGGGIGGGLLGAISGVDDELIRVMSACRSCCSGGSSGKGNKKPSNKELIKQAKKNKPKKKSRDKSVENIRGPCTKCCSPAALREFEQANQKLGKNGVKQQVKKGKSEITKNKKDVKIETTGPNVEKAFDNARETVVVTTNTDSKSSVESDTKKAAAKKWSFGKRAKEVMKTKSKEMLPIHKKKGKDVEPAEGDKSKSEASTDKRSGDDIGNTSEDDGSAVKCKDISKCIASMDPRWREFGDDGRTLKCKDISKCEASRRQLAGAACQKCCDLATEVLNSLKYKGMSFSEFLKTKGHCPNEGSDMCKECCGLNTQCPYAGISTKPSLANSQNKGEGTAVTDRSKTSQTQLVGSFANLEETKLKKQFVSEDKGKKDNKKPKSKESLRTLKTKRASWTHIAESITDLIQKSRELKSKELLQNETKDVDVGTRIYKSMETANVSEGSTKGKKTKKKKYKEPKKSKKAQPIVTESFDDSMPNNPASILKKSIEPSLSGTPKKSDAPRTEEFGSDFKKKIDATKTDTSKETGSITGNIKKSDATKTDSKEGSVSGNIKKSDAITKSAISKDLGRLKKSLPVPVSFGGIAKKSDYNKMTSRDLGALGRSKKSFPGSLRFGSTVRKSDASNVGPRTGSLADNPEEATTKTDQSTGPEEDSENSEKTDETDEESKQTEEITEAPDPLAQAPLVPKLEEGSESCTEDCNDKCYSFRVMTPVDQRAPSNRYHIDELSSSETDESIDTDRKKIKRKKKGRLQQDLQPHKTPCNLGHLGSYVTDESVSDDETPPAKVMKFSLFHKKSKTEKKNSKTDKKGTNESDSKESGGKKSKTSMNSDDSKSKRKEKAKKESKKSTKSTDESDSKQKGGKKSKSKSEPLKSRSSKSSQSSKSSRLSSYSD